MPPTGLVEDTLSFCHPELDGGVIALTVGLLQFLPWFVGPTVFLYHADAGREVLYRLWLLYLKVFALAAWIVQLVVAQPIPNATCTDPWGSPYGMPSLGAGFLGVYIALAVGQHSLWWRAPPSGSLLFTLALYGVAGPLALVVNGLHTGMQVLVGLGTGLLYGALATAITRVWVAPYGVPAILADPSGLGVLLGTQDTYLGPAYPHASAASRHDQLRQV